MVYIMNASKTYERHGVDKYLTAVGLVVNKKYRGLGIATEVLKARRPLLEALGLTLTSTIFTGPGSQKAALNAGYVEEYSIR
jgi:GNAT superfamily N-acetyltransferase